MTLNILLGAGFSQGLGLPGTDRITEHVRHLQQFTVAGDDHTSAPLAQVLWKVASSYYDEPTFETLLHIAESMISAQESRLGFTLDDSQKVAFNAFMDVAPRLETILATNELARFAADTLSQVATYLDQSMENSPPKSWNMVRAFLSRLLELGNVRISTLNYDDTIERSVSDKVWDGFTGESPGVIDYSSFRRNHEIELLHLHGSVRFAPAPQQQRPGWVPRLDRYNSSAAAAPKRNTSLEFKRTSQSGERIFIGPLISGLRKADKLLVEPYASYHQRFQEGAAESPRFLCIGYGGGDTYLNATILRAREQHGPHFRAVYVMKIHDDTLGTRAFRRAAYLPAVHSITWWHEFGPFLERLQANDFILEENQMLLIGTGFPLTSGQLDRVVNFLHS